MISVLIVGNGNVATHLYTRLEKEDDILLNKINSRNINNIPKSDVTILAVSDDAICEVSKKIDNSFVVHTSGSMPLNELKNNSRKGVFYMLQTFTKDKSVDFSQIPFCLEAENKEDYQVLESLSKMLSKRVYSISSEQRKILHVAAVFVNNFTNHLFKIGNDICKENNVPFEILHPLIQETAIKILSVSPEEAQTGPAKRNDEKTIKNHLTLLNQKQQEIYNILTDAIQNGNKL